MEILIRHPQHIQLQRNLACFRTTQCHLLGSRDIQHAEQSELSRDVQFVRDEEQCLHEALVKPCFRGAEGLLSSKWERNSGFGV